MTKNSLLKGTSVKHDGYECILAGQMIYLCKFPEAIKQENEGRNVDSSLMRTLRLSCRTDAPTDSLQTHLQGAAFEVFIQALDI